MERFRPRFRERAWMSVSLSFSEGERRRFLSKSPLSPALSPLVPRGEREENTGPPFMPNTIGGSPVPPDFLTRFRFAGAIYALALLTVCFGTPLLAAERFTVSMPAWVSSLSFSPASKQLAVGCADSSARPLEVATGKKTVSFRGHENYVASVAFSPDGKSSANGGECCVRRQFRCH